MESERADMYHTLTLVNNKFVKSIPEKLSWVIQSILCSRLPAINQSELSKYQYCGEQHCDVLVLLGYLSRTSSKAHNEFTKFADFLQSSVISYHKTGGKLYGSRPSSDPNFNDLCGLSLYLPETEQAIFRYSSLALYQEVDLLGLYRGMHTR